MISVVVAAGLHSLCRTMDIVTGAREWTVTEMYEDLIRDLRDPNKPVDCNEVADAIEKLNRIIYLLESDRDAERELRLYAEENTPRWIPVTERLPGREWVLCKCRAKIHEVLSLQGGYWYHDPQHQYMSGFVTHWMPLPEAPKEEET